MPVCGNTADMLSLTRYAAHFDVIGGKDQHFGVFECGPAAPVVDGAAGCC